MTFFDNFKEKLESKKTFKKLLSWLFQLLVFVFIFKAASMWQQRNMLPSSDKRQAPSIVLPDLKGELRTINFLSNDSDNKQTLVYFFAPWCTVCHYSVDSLESIKQSQSHPNLQIFMVALDWRSKQEVEEFLAKHELSVPVILGTQTTSKDYQIGGFPSYYLISNTGEIVAKDMGFTTQLGIKSRLLIN